MRSKGGFVEKQTNVVIKVNCKIQKLKESLHAFPIYLRLTYNILFLISNSKTR